MLPTQDVIDGVNYENTGELGAEMGGKPVQHGAEVPPNAVRPAPGIRIGAGRCRR